MPSKREWKTSAKWWHHQFQEHTKRKAKERDAEQRNFAAAKAELEEMLLAAEKRIEALEGYNANQADLIVEAWAERDEYKQQAIGAGRRATGWETGFRDLGADFEALERENQRLREAVSDLEGLNAELSFDLADKAEERKGWKIAGAKPINLGFIQYEAH